MSIDRSRGVTLDDMGRSLRQPFADERIGNPSARTRPTALAPWTRQKKTTHSPQRWADIWPRLNSGAGRSVPRARHVPTLVVGRSSSMALTKHGVKPARRVEHSIARAVIDANLGSARTTSPRRLRFPRTHRWGRFLHIARRPEQSPAGPATPTTGPTAHKSATRKASDEGES